MCGFAPHDASARRAKSCSRRRISSVPTALLEREHEPGADRLDDRRRAALLADLRVRVVGVAVRADEQDRPAAGHRRHAVAEQRALDDEHAGRPGAADELVRREEDRVLVGEPRAGAGSCRSAGTGRRPRSPSTTARRGGAARSRPRSTSVMIPVTFEAAEKLPIFSGRSAWRRSSCLEVVDVDAPVGVLADRDDLGDRLAPGQLVRVVLVRADEHHRPLARGSEREQPDRAVSIAPVEPEPQKRTTSSGPPSTARWMTRRASSRSAVVCRPVADASVCVLA